MFSFFSLGSPKPKNHLGNPKPNPCAAASFCLMAYPASAV